MRTEAVAYMTTGSGMPDAVLNSTLGTGFSVMLVICSILACANNDIRTALPPG